MVQSLNAAAQQAALLLGLSGTSPSPLHNSNALKVLLWWLKNKELAIISAAGWYSTQRQCDRHTHVNCKSMHTKSIH